MKQFIIAMQGPNETEVKGRLLASFPGLKVVKVSEMKPGTFKIIFTKGKKNGRS